MNALNRWLRRNRFISYGLPFMVLLVGGSFALKQFAQLRYTFRKKQLLTPEEAELLGVNMRLGKDAPTLEGEYEKVREINIDHWTNIRGPRPWEADSSKPAAS